MSADVASIHWDKIALDRDPGGGALLPSVTHRPASWFWEKGQHCSLALACFLKLFLKRFYLFIFRERGREIEREGEKHQCVVASHMPPTGDLAHNPGMGAQTGNRTGGPLLRSPVLDPLSHTIQSCFLKLLLKKEK